MKTSKILLSSLLAAAAMSTVPAWAETTVDGTTYSGNIYTWANTGTSQADIAYGAWKLSTWSDTGYSYGDSITTWASVQPLICSVPAGSELNTIRFDASVGSNSNMKYTFEPLAIGGIIVESGASDFAINASGAKRAINLGRDGKTGTSTFHENFTLNTSASSEAGAVTIAGTQTWTIDSGKTFTINSGAYAITQSGTLTVSGEGTAKFTTTGGVAFNGTVSVDSGATLDLSGAKVTLANAIMNTGTVTLSDSTIFNLTKAGESVSLISGGTISGVEWSKLSESNFNYNGNALNARSSVDVGISGAVTLNYVASKTLTWGGASTGTWDTTTTNKPWKDGDNDEAFYSGDSVVFSKDGTSTITVDSAGVTAGTMTVSAGTVALSGGKVTAASLNVESGAQLNVGNTVSATSLSGAGTVQLSSLSGLSTTFATGTSGWTGAVVLKNIDTGKDFNPNNYGIAGSKVVFDGVGGSNFYFLAGSGTQGSGTRTFEPDIEIASGGLTLTNGFSSTVYTFSGAISGSGTWKESNKNVAQQYVFTGDVSGFSGTLELQKASKVTFGNGGDGVTGDGKSVSGTGTITMADTGAVLTYNYSNDVSASTTLAGGMSVVKQGAGSLTLTGTNTFSGGVTVSKGTLVAGSASALGTGKTTVAADAKLGLIAGTTVTVAGGVELADGAKIVVDMSSISKAETFTLDLITGTALTYNSTIVSSTNANSLLGDVVSLSNWDKDGWIKTLSFDDTSSKLSLTMTIPEPSTFGLLAGVGALAFVSARRRRRAK